MVRMEQGRAEGFDGFVATRWSALFHLARLLVGGDRHRAEDLLQEALVKLWFVWPKIEEEAPEAYVRKVMARAAARSARRRWWGERPVEQLPDLADVGDVSASVAERTRLEVALVQLPPRQRAWQCGREGARCRRYRPRAAGRDTEAAHPAPRRGPLAATRRR